LEKDIKILIENYDNKLKILIGKTISKVRYFEINDGEPAWDKIEFHSIDYGVELITSDNQSFYFIWDKQFTAYDLKFQIGSIRTEFSKEDDSAFEFNVSDNEKWIELIGQKIIGIKSNWSFFRSSRMKKKNFYPQDVEIKFANKNSIYISAMEISREKTMTMKDHITLVFDENTAKKYNIGLKNVV